MDIMDIPLTGTLDRRKKLSEKDKETIRRLWAEPNHPTAEAIGKIFKVRKTTILTVVNPDYARKRSEYQKQNCHKYYGSRTKEQRHNTYIESKKYKQTLLKLGLITPDSMAKSSTGSI